MSQKKYWQGFGQLNDPESFNKKNRNEFQEDLPFGDFESQ
ncbi:MAG TPA: TAT-variant-translocated molybdopterin oxidoreductase, partial [Niabella sp.]|nr:TAT-variant-translocated molybdopterin oxidoreductase [Niabella sp.]